MPVAHARIQAHRDVERAAADLTVDHLWARPGGGVVVGPDILVTRMFSEAGARCGARMEPVLSVEAADLLDRVKKAELVAAATWTPPTGWRS